MSSKKTTTFKSNLSRLAGGPASGVIRDNPLRGFSSSASIDFGKPSDRKALTSNGDNGANWGKLAEQAASGGIASLFHSSSAASVFGGLGSLISGIAGLFGGDKKAPPPPQLFELPQAVNQTVHVNSMASAPALHVQVQSMDTQSLVSRSNEIAQAVKMAMLNSHSLNDVISEL